MKNHVSAVILFAILCPGINGCNSRATVKPQQRVVCGVSDPVNNLKWLNNQFKQFVGGPTLNGIVVYEYDNKTVIEVQNSLFSSLNQHQYFCDGTKLNLNAPNAYTEYTQKRKEVMVLYGTNMWK